LNSKLVTKLIKDIIKLIKQLKELFSRVKLNYEIKMLDINEYHGNFSFFDHKVIVARSDLVSHK
jgi:hypothetical protein